jgi:hypothetical protein
MASKLTPEPAARSVETDSGCGIVLPVLSPFKDLLKRIRVKGRKYSVYA